MAYVVAATYTVKPGDQETTHLQEHILGEAIPRLERRERACHQTL